MGVTGAIMGLGVTELRRRELVNGVILEARRERLGSMSRAGSLRCGLRNAGNDLAYSCDCGTRRYILRHGAALRAVRQ